MKASESALQKIERQAVSPGHAGQLLYERYLVHHGQPGKHPERQWHNLPFHERSAWTDLAADINERVAQESA